MPFTFTFFDVSSNKRSDVCNAIRFCIGRRQQCMQATSTVHGRNHKGRQSMSFKSTEFRRVLEVASLVNVREEARDLDNVEAHL